MTAEKNHSSIQQLIQQCQQETARYQTNQRHHEEPCLKLFRWAIVENNQPAWNAIHAQYRPLVLSWVRQHSQFRLLAESADVFANAAFLKFWKAMSPEKFSQSQNLGALLSYLKLCVHSTLIDEIRRRQRQAHEVSRWDEITALEKHYPSVETLVIHQTTADALEWLVRQQLQDETEEVVMTLSWFYGLPPREIQARNPHLFATVREVYRIKRNILNRLLRDPEIQQILNGNN